MTTRQGKTPPTPLPRPQHRIGRVAFMGVIEQVKAELAAGWSARAIYWRLEKKLSGKISYQQFCRYVRRLQVAAPPLGHAIMPTRPPARRRGVPLPPAPAELSDEDDQPRPPPRFRPGKLK